MSKKKAEEAKPKRPTGRPSKYKPEYNEKMLLYFNRDLFTIVTEQRLSNKGDVVEVEVKKASVMPTFEEFCGILDIDTDTLLEWRDVYPTFSGTYKKCKEIQKKFLVAHGLSGGYSSNFAKFIAVNCTDLVDKKEIKQEHSGAVEYGLGFDLSKAPK